MNVHIPDEKDIRLNLEGNFVDIMYDVNTDHVTNIWYKNGNKVLYLRILKDLYRCIELDILWYNLYANTLKELGFVINPYDRCIVNKIIHMKQYTI